MSRISIQEYFDNSQNTLLLDVRTPLEFKTGHIIGAINFPLYSNEERIQVGTTYKKVNPQKALIQGLSFVGPKMASFVEKALKLGKDKRIVIYCWRGGKRSSSMGWLLTTAGLNVDVIEGGYKSYRQYMHQQFIDMPLDLCILSGPTGSGKTLILKIMQKKGVQFVDLEALAKHKGSAFGALGEDEQPTSEHFHNLLFNALRDQDPSKKIWLEGESKGIGKVYLMEPFWQRMSEAYEIEIEVPLERRVNHLVKLYGAFDIELLKASFDKILKRIGGLNHKLALKALDENRLDIAATYALNYYDKAYIRGRKERPHKKHLFIDEDYEKAAEIILKTTTE